MPIVNESDAKSYVRTNISFSTTAPISNRTPISDSNLFLFTLCTQIGSFLYLSINNSVNKRSEYNDNRMESLNCYIRFYSIMYCSLLYLSTEDMS